MYDVRITVVRKASYSDLSQKYENPIEHACDINEGETWVSHNGQKPDGSYNSFHWSMPEPMD